MSKQYIRMSDNEITPSVIDIQNFLGTQSYNRMTKFENRLHGLYELNKILKVDFSGWGYKYMHKNTHICFLCFEQNAFTLSFHINDKSCARLYAKFNDFTPKTQEIWKNRYRCGDEGGWIHYRVLSDEELDDVIELIKIKKNPPRK